MSKLWLIGLAASAAVAPMAAAQTVRDPAPAALKAPAAATAAFAGHPGPGAVVRRELRRGPGHHGARHFEFRRIHRGGMLPHRWMGHRFHVRNWGMYGFPQPFAGGRWIRYYDDALLVDRYGRVHDGRYGWEWDRYRDRWSRDHDGVPIYDGDDDYDREDWDEEWAEDRDDRRRGPDHVYRHHGPMPPPPPAYGYGYGYGCGCGPVVVTETTTTTEPVVETRTYYEYVTERSAPRRHYRKPVRRSVKARPGERG